MSWRVRQFSKTIEGFARYESKKTASRELKVRGEIWVLGFAKRLSLAPLVANETSLAWAFNQIKDECL